MDSIFDKIGHGNHMDNDIETEPKTRHSTPGNWSAEVNNSQQNATKLCERLTYTLWLGRRVIKPYWYGEERTVKILIVKGICCVYPSFYTILFVCSTSVVFMLLDYFNTNLFLLFSQTIVHATHFIYHSTSHSFHLP